MLTSQQGSRYPAADRDSGRHNHEVGTIVDRGSDSGEKVEGADRQLCSVELMSHRLLERPVTGCVGDAQFTSVG